MVYFIPCTDTGSDTVQVHAGCEGHVLQFPSRVRPQVPRTSSAASLQVNHLNAQQTWKEVDGFIIIIGPIAA